MIAKIASQKARKLNAPVFTQADISMDCGLNVSYVRETWDPPSTLRIAREAIRWAEDAGLEELWIVAAKPNLWRVFRDMKEMAREAGSGIKIHTCREIDDECSEDLWFCTNSQQPRTRSQEAWDGRENVLKKMPFFLYKIIAG